MDWIWNKGIASLCDYRFPEDFLNGTYAFHGSSIPLSDKRNYRYMLSGISEGEIVWIRSELLEYFVQNIFPEIKYRFVLITADSDLSMPSAFPESAKILLESLKLIHWYTQNFDGSSTNPKMSLIPIGMDFHTLQQRTCWGMPRMEIIEQNEMLNQIRHRLAPTLNRKAKIYVDSCFRYNENRIPIGSINSLNRKGVFNSIAENSLIYEQPDFLPQDQMWKKRGEYIFVLCHHGNGLDCHRTWEALVLGHIVIMQRSSLDPLFDDLPVVLISDWSEINQKNIDRWQSEFKNRTYKMEQLTNQYWIKEIRNRASSK